MSKRWHLGGVIVAAVIAVAALTDPTRFDLPVIGSEPRILVAAVWAAIAYVYVWFVEGVAGSVRWLWRRTHRDPN